LDNLNIEDGKKIIFGFLDTWRWDRWVLPKRR